MYLETALVIAATMFGQNPLVPSGAHVVIRTYTAPVGYYATVFAHAAKPPADYVYMTGEIPRFEVIAVNAANSQTVVNVRSIARGISLMVARDPAAATYVPFAASEWELDGPVIVRQVGTTAYPVESESVAVLPAGASLVLPIRLAAISDAQVGIVRIRADLQMSCGPTCLVVPHSSEFRFEARPLDGNLERLDALYRQAQDGFRVGRADIGWMRLREIETIYPNSSQCWYLRAVQAEREGRRSDALAAYREAAALLRSGRDTVALSRIPLERWNEFLFQIDSSIRALQGQR